jgi:quinol monooxygenase YgiN
VLPANLALVDAGERGNVVFAVHASNHDPREFWLYETWTDPDAVEAHESGPAFKSYKDELRWRGPYAVATRSRPSSRSSTSPTPARGGPSTATRPPASRGR